jgi:hypothetical protein
MSVSNIIDASGVIAKRYLPDPYPYPATQGLGAVLAVSGVGNSLPMSSVGNIGCANIQAPFGSILSLGSDLIQNGVTPDLGILPAGNLTLKGAQTKGNILAGDGTSTVGLPLGATGYVLKANPATATGLEWAIDISGVTGVVGVNAGANIDISGTVSQPIVSLKSPLTTTLNMGAVALQDISGATGTSGQFLSAGVGGQAKWETPAYPVVSVVAGTNIDVSGTTTSTVSLKNPLTAQLNLGNQDIVGLSGASEITVNGGGVVINDTTAPTSIISNTVRDSEIVILTADGPSGQFDRTTLNNTTLTLEQQDLTVPTLTKTAIYGNCSTSEVINDTTTTETSSHTTTNTANSANENFTITGGSGESFALFNLKSTGAGSDYQTLYTASTGDSSQQRQIVSGGGSVLVQQFNVAGGTVSTANNIQTNTVQAIQSMSYGSSAGNVAQVGIEADASRVRMRNLCTTPSGGGNIDTGTSIITEGAGCSLTQTYTQGATSVTTALSTTSGLTSLTTDAPFTISSSGGNLNLTSTASVGVAGQGVIIQASTQPMQFSSPASNIQYSSSTGQQVLVSSLNNASAPTYTVTNTNASTASYPAIKLDRPTPASGTQETIGSISMWADDASNVSREYVRLQAKTENVSPGNVDGTLSVLAIINSSASPTEIFNFNGGQNEINSFRPFDLNGNAVRTSQGDMTIDTSASAGNGVLTLATKNATGGLSITGDKTISATAGGSSGQHLVLTIQGVVYKIALLNP